MSGHQNRRQKLSYLEKIREENTNLTNERNKYQLKCSKLETKMRLLEEDLRYFRTENPKPNLFSLQKWTHEILSIIPKHTHKNQTFIALI